MAGDIIERIGPYVHEILRIVLEVGNTSKLELHSITIQAKVITVQNYHVEREGEEEAPRPICVEFKHLRRSGRLAPTKRTYEKMQGTNNSTGRR